MSDIEYSVIKNDVIKSFDGSSLCVQLLQFYADSVDVLIII